MRRVAVIVSLVLWCVLCGAQEAVRDSVMGDSIGAMDSVVRDSAVVKVDSVMKDSLKVDSLMRGTVILRNGSEEVSRPLYANFKPDPNKSLWLSMAIPGAGQIYNRKYWKLPIIYGLGVGIGYAIAYTNRNYQDYRNAYQTYNSSQPNPDLYKHLIPSGYPESSYSSYFKTQMDDFRRSRDLSIVAAVLAYALQVIDAFVDAQLCDFDVSPDLSIKMAPEVQQVNNEQAVGVGAAVKF